MEINNLNTDPKLSKIVESLKKELSPTRLFLYGSRANGTARSDSDYDFVAVLSSFDSKLRHEVMARLSSQLWKDHDAEVQVWVYSQADFDDWSDEFSSTPETPLNTGIEISLI